MEHNNQQQHRVIIIGAGSAGLCMGVQLKKAGINDFVILEKGDGIGGTWWHNSYPGAECDVQSHLYSFSFEQKTDWSRPFAGQQEILAYLNHIADTYGLRSHIQLHTTVASASWQSDTARWKVVTEAGQELEFKIIKLNLLERKIGLSIRALTEVGEREALEERLDRLLDHLPVCRQRHPAPGLALVLEAAQHDLR